MIAITSGIALRSHTGLEYDSVTYLDLAANVVAGKGLVHRWAYWDPIYEAARLPTATTMWPPGLSLAIAGLHALGMSPSLAGRITGVLAFAAFAVALYGMARLIVRPAQGFVAVLVALIPELPWLPRIASELPYLAAATIASLCAAKAVLGDRHREIAWWICASAAAGAAFAFRYVGLAIAFQICLVAFLFGRGQGWRRNIRRAALAGSVSGVVIASVLLRNWMISGTFGQPWPGADIFWSTLLPSVRAAVAIELGGREVWGSLALVAVPAQVLALGLLALVSIRGLRSAGNEAANARAVTGSTIMILMLACTYAVTIAATAANGMDLEDRYLLTPVPWAILLLTAWCVRSAAAAQRPLLAPASIALGVFLTFQGLLTLKVLASPQDSYVQAAGSSDVVAWLRQHVPPDEMLLSNRGAELAYWLPNPVMRLPRLPHASGGATNWEDVDDLAQKAGARYLVHFRNYPEYAKYHQQEFDFLRTLDHSSAFMEREPQTFIEATVYRVDLRARSAGPP